MIILPTAYLGNIQYYTKLLQTEQTVVIDGGEHYVKQSLRNRCDILGANGVIALTVPVLKKSGEKTAVKEVRIDYTKAWQHQHWNSIHSAYKGSPYFDFFGERFELFYRKRYDFLWDFNREIGQAVFDILKIKPDINESEVYVETMEGDLDLRQQLSSKPRLQSDDPHFSPASYHQVFADRAGFVPNLSVLDLLFCEGRYATGIIRESFVSAG